MTKMSKFTKENELCPTIVRVKRTREKITQACDLYISKPCTAAGWCFPKSKWFERGTTNDPEEYIDYLKSNDELCAQVYELVGQTLGCWCAGKKQDSCHGKILIDETKKFLKQYFKQFKNNTNNANIANNKSKSPKMDITPLQTFYLKIIKTPNTAKKYTLKIKTKVDVEPPVKKIRLSKVPDDTDDIVNTLTNIINWEKDLNKWVLPNGLKLTEDMRIPVDARITFGCNYHRTDTSFHLKKGSKLTDAGRVHISAFIAKPVKINPSVKHQPPAIPVTDFDYYTVKFDKNPVITQSAIGNLFTKKLEKWDPFVCRVEARMFHKKSNRYMLQLFDGTALYKVHLGSQLFELIKQKFIDKGDLIQVIDYTSTILNSRKRLVVLYNIKKIIYNERDE